MYILFDDGSGDAIVRSSWPSPADRAQNWIPANYRPKGGGAHTLASEQRHVFTPLGVDHGASFEIRGIAMGAEIDGALDAADRLIAHLLDGGTCEVHLEDTPNASYDNCCLKPETTPTLTQTDATHLEYTLALAVINLDGDPMTAHYGAA